MRALTQEEMVQVAGGWFSWCRTSYWSYKSSYSTSCYQPKTYSCEPKTTYTCEPKPVCEPKPSCEPKPVCPPVEIPNE
jgi:hypothetical protein